jgi:hypothetical protein
MCVCGCGMGVEVGFGMGVGASVDVCPRTRPCLGEEALRLAAGDAHVGMKARV